MFFTQAKLQSCNTKLNMVVENDSQAAIQINLYNYYNAFLWIHECGLHEEFHEWLCALNLDT